MMFLMAIFTEIVSGTKLSYNTFLRNLLNTCILTFAAHFSKRRTMEIFTVT